MVATHSNILAWKISWTEEGCGPWVQEELDMTEQLTHTKGRASESRKMIREGSKLEEQRKKSKW